MFFLVSNLLLSCSVGVVTFITTSIGFILPELSSIYLIKSKLVIIQETVMCSHFVKERVTFTNFVILQDLIPLLPILIRQKV